MEVRSEDLYHLLEELNSKGALQKTIADHEDLFKIGALDSMAVVQFILAIEKRYKIKIGKKDISFNSFSNLANIKSLIESKFP